MSEWNLRIAPQKQNMADGITFYMWERFMENCRGETAYRDRKMHLDGKVSLTIAQGQTKYGDELIAQVYGSEAKILERRASGYNRIQVFLGTIDESTAKMLEQAALTIRNILEQRAKETSVEEPINDQ